MTWFYVLSYNVFSVSLLGSFVAEKSKTETDKQTERKRKGQGEGEGEGERERERERTFFPSPLNFFAYFSVSFLSAKPEM